MFKILTLNKISPLGLTLLPPDKYEHASELPHPDGILVRSQDMLKMEIPGTVKAIARAGAGVNNIPIERCSEQGIVVFNTPGANANAVKELVILGLLLGSRKVYQGIAWTKSLAGKGEDVKKRIEKEKSNFTGPEIKGKTLGILGLGAIGVLVANDAAALGMKVIGRDPYISVESAWGLSRDVQCATSLENLISECEYISIHMPLTDETRGFLNRNRFKFMKKGVVLLNFSREELVDEESLIEALQDGTVSTYVTDFPGEALLKLDNVIPIPHLGASTPEAEDNCAIMAVRQMREFLENGNITNSVNFPGCFMERSGKKRVVIGNKNIPNMIGQITPILAANNTNISDFLNKSKGDYAYNIIDIDSDIDETTINALKKINGVVMVRVI